jgi:hypothetical protein
MLQQELERGCTPPQKKIAAPAGPRNGGTKADSFEAQVKPRLEQCRKAEQIARVHLIPAWNDDQHLTGWISVGEAAANVLDEIGGAS